MFPPIRGLSGSWLPTTPPARRVGGEIRAPDTLVDTISYATADGGSIPPVSTRQDRPQNSAFAVFAGDSRSGRCAAERIRANETAANARHGRTGWSLTDTGPTQIRASVSVLVCGFDIVDGRAVMSIGRVEKPDQDTGVKNQRCQWSRSRSSSPAGRSRLRCQRDGEQFAMPA